MRSFRFPLAAASLVTLAACAVADRPAGEGTAQVASAIGEEENALPLFVLDSGHWIDGGEDGATIQSFWIDLSIRNDAYAKSAGVIWTADGWSTSHTTAATYAGGLGAGRERWSVQARDFATTAPWLAPLEVEYAAFVTMNGVTTWSPFRNHYIYDPVSPAKPVRILSSSVAMGSDGAPHLHGRARALNVAAPRHVFVRYTVDAWRTSADAEATFDGRDFAFDVPLHVDPATTSAVTFAVRLDTSGQSAWDNAGGANVTLGLAPSLASASLVDDPGVVASGIRLLAGSVTTGLPVDAVGVRFDGGPRVALGPSPSNGAPGVGFTPSGGFLCAFDSAGFTDGDHTIAVDAAAGPFTRAFAPITFHVGHGIAYRATWTPAKEANGTFWDFARDSKGVTYLLGEHDVRAYAALGAASPLRTFATATIASTLMDVDVDAGGRVYAVGGSSLVRWDASGAIDATFGKAGVVDFSVGAWGASGVCYPANLAVVGPNLVIVDSCNARVLRLTLDGAFVDELDLATSAAYTNVSRTFVRGDELWVSRTSGGNDLTRDLVRLATGASPLAVVGTIPLDASYGDVDAFAVTSDSAWIADDRGNLRHIDLAGKLLATWLGGGGDLSLPGSLEIVKRIEPLDASSVAVLGVEAGHVVTFDAH